MTDFFGDDEVETAQQLNSQQLYTETAQQYIIACSFLATCI